MSEKRELYIHFSAKENFKEINYVLKSVIRTAVAATLEYENFPYPAEVSVTLCSAEHIHGLNKQYRGVDRPTDVLSFPMYEDGNFDPDECILGAPLGDIVISVPSAKEQAEEYGHSYERELHYLLVHGIMHCLGYDHMTDEEKAEMREKEEWVLGKLGIMRE